MGTLFKTALTRKNRLLLLLAVFSMIMLTISSQLEILSIGVITRKGPDIFEVFAPLHDGKLEKTQNITLQEIEARWPQLDAKKKGYVTLEDTSNFISQHKKFNLLDWVTQFINSIIPVSTSFKALAFFLLFVGLFKALFLFGQRVSSSLISIRVSRNLRQAYFEHIQSLPLEFYQKHNIGSLSSRVVADAAWIAEAVNDTVINYIETPFTIISTFILCFLSSWQLTLIVFFGCPAIVFPVLFLARKVKKIAKQIQKNQEIFASVLIDFLSGIQTVKVFAMEEFSLKKYREQNDKMAALERRNARYDNAARPIIHTIGMGFLASTLMFGLFVLQMNVTDVLIYCGLLYIFYEPVKKIAERNTHIQRGVAAAERMQEVLNLHPQIKDHDEAIDLESFTGPIEFDNVWFAYDRSWVLKGVSFKINKGETVAIVGHTGSGKSTIVQLLPRLYDPQKGMILINGKPLTSFTQKSLREKMAFVPQKPFLFLDTIAENISFGRPFSQAEIQEAAKKANADEFIERLPLSYNTELAEAGKNLSGGQQQRLAIARALVKKAPILILDEATSALDALSENKIKNALKDLRGTMTQIIIAHRLSTIDDADKIIFLENGEKIAEGTKEELLQNCPGFRRIYEAQHQSKLEDAEILV